MDWRVVHLPTIDSTNAEARRRVESGAARAGLVLVADEQTAGRGRRGRRWHTVPGRSLAASVVLDRPVLRRPARLTILAAVAAARALEAAGADRVSIKWPNDLMRDNRKIGGLLVESARRPDGSEALVLGLGVNLALRPGDLPEELTTLAGAAGLTGELTTLAGAAGLTGDEPMRDAVLASFLDELAAALSELGDASDTRRGEEYRHRSWLTGRRVTLAWATRTDRVTITDVTADGDLVLADGRVAPGEHVQLVDDDGSPPGPSPPGPSR